MARCWKERLLGRAEILVRIVLLTHGTRGDVQPFVALAAALAARGHDARLAAPENLASFVAAAGVPCVPLPGDTRAFLMEPGLRHRLERGDVVSFSRTVARVAEMLGEAIGGAAEDACRGADAVVASMLMEDLGAAVAEAHHVPVVGAHTIPVRRTGDFPSPLLTTRRVPVRALCRLSHDVYDQACWRLRKDVVNRFRRRLGLPPASRSFLGSVRRRGPLVLHLWSDRVVPRPSDWGESDPTTGFWRLQPSVRERMGEAGPPEGLEEWIAAGPPPFYVGFGSLPFLEPRRLLEDVDTAARALGIRVVLGGGWTEIDALVRTDRIFVARSVDHSWLFPRCAGVVHHGGAGTTATGLEAGVPTFIFSAWADQPFWGARVARLGAGGHTPYRRFSAATLVRGLRILQRPGVRARARTIGSALQVEDGLGRAVEAIETRLAS